MRRVFPRMHQHDRAGDDAIRPRRGERLARRVLVERRDLGPVRADPAADLDHPFVEHGGKPDREVEQPRARLVADPERIGEARIDDQQRALAAALEQRVGRDGGAHLHRVDRAARDRCVGGEAEHRANAGERRVAVAAGVFAQQLAGGEVPRGVARHDVGEGAAAIDPELPAHARPRCRASMGAPRKCDKPARYLRARSAPARTRTGPHPHRPRGSIGWPGGGAGRCRIGADRVLEPSTSACYRAAWDIGAR